MRIRCICKGRVINFSGKRKNMKFGEEIELDTTIAKSYISLPYFEEVKESKDKGDKKS